MANYSERRITRLYGAKIAMVAGIIVALIGIYFVVGISGSTNKKNAECTEETVGTVISSLPSGSKYNTTVEYTPGYEPIMVTFETKNQYTEGSEVPVKFNPTSFKKVYIEGMSPTGKNDVVQGVIFILVGTVLGAGGFLLDRKGKGV